MCDVCNAWFHPKCQGLSSEEFKALSKFDFLWLCMECKPMLRSLVNVKKDLENCIATTEKKIFQSLNDMKLRTNIEEEMEKKFVKMEGKFLNQMKEQQVQVEASLQEQTKVVQALP